MNKNDIKVLIQQIAREEFTLYPESYTTNDPLSPGCWPENISEWAMNMWESRSDEEITRDKKLGLHPDNYISWAFETFEDVYQLKVPEVLPLKIKKENKPGGAGNYPQTLNC